MNEVPKCSKHLLIHAFQQVSIITSYDQIGKINFKFWWSPVVITSDVTSKVSSKSSVMLLSDVVYPSEELWSLVSSALPRFDTGNLVVAFTSCAKLEEGEPVSHVNQWVRYRVMGDCQNKPTWSWSRYIHICTVTYITIHKISWCIYTYVCIIAWPSIVYTLMFSEIFIETLCNFYQFLHFSTTWFNPPHPVGWHLQVDGRCIRRSSWNLWSDSWVVSIPWSPEDYPWQLTALPSFSSVITGGQKLTWGTPKKQGVVGESRFFGFKVMERCRIARNTLFFVRLPPPKLSKTYCVTYSV